MLLHLMQAIERLASDMQKKLQAANNGPLSHGAEGPLPSVCIYIYLYMYMYMYVCMYIYYPLYVCVCLCVCVCIYIYRHIN
jgi:hypothetical protein